MSVTSSTTPLTEVNSSGICFAFKQIDVNLWLCWN